MYTLKLLILFFILPNLTLSRRESLSNLIKIANKQSYEVSKPL